MEEINDSVNFGGDKRVWDREYNWRYSLRKKGGHIFEMRRKISKKWRSRNIISGGGGLQVITWRGSFYFLISSESYGAEISLRPWKEWRFERAALRNRKGIFRNAVKYQDLTEVEWCALQCLPLLLLCDVIVNYSNFKFFWNKIVFWGVVTV